MQIKFTKLLHNATTPTRATDGSNGFDLTAAQMRYLGGDIIEYDTGIGFEIPLGYVGLVFPRSSVYTRQLMLANSVGVIDSDYRGPVKLMYVNRKDLSISHAHDSEYAVGERIGQIVFVPTPEIQLVESETLSSTDRGTGGFGSTGQ